MKRLVSKMTVFMATIAMSLLTHAATYYGLFVGVNEYSDADYLYGCDWDAMRMMDAYTRGGYCDAANAELLTNLSATKQAVREKFAALAGTATAGDTVLYFQSSHGGCAQDASGNDTKDAYLCLTDENWSDAEFAEDLAKFADGVRVVVIIDACCSGGMFKSPGGNVGGKRKGGWDFASRVQRLLKARRAAAKGTPSVAWITAAEWNQVSYTDGRGSELTHALLAGWEDVSADEGGDDKVSFGELADYAKSNVPGSNVQTENDTLLNGIPAGQAFDVTTFRLLSSGGTVYGLLGECPANLVIPAGTTALADGPFDADEADMTELLTVSLPDGLETIGYKTFYGCDGVESLTIPESVTFIDYCAFEDCLSLETVTFQGDRDEIAIDAEAFTGTPYEDTMPALFLIDEDGWLYDYRGVVPSVLDFPTTVRVISASVFAGVDELRYLYIPTNVVAIGESAFEACTNLVEVLFDGMEPEQDGDRRYFLETLEIGYSAFTGCSALTSVDIPSHVSYLDEYAFSDCTSLESVVFIADDTVTESWLEIAPTAFIGCSALTTVDFEDRPYDLDQDIYNSVVIGDNVFDQCQALTSLHLGEGIEGIGEAAFYGTGVEEVRIPASCQYIDDSAFADCENLEEVFFTGEDMYGDDYEITLGERVFEDTPWGNRFRIVCEDGVLTGFTGWIPDGEFVDLDITNKVTAIEDGVFEGLAGLRSVHIPASVTSIGENAFAYCPDLETVTFEEKAPELVEGMAVDDQGVMHPYSKYCFGELLEIGPSAFEGCEALAWVDLPAHVSALGKSAFAYCLALEEVYFLADASVEDISLEVGEEAFVGCSSLATVYFEDRAYDPENNIWNDICINTSAFDSCQALTELRLGDGVASISDLAFYDTDIESLVIPASCQYIGDAAFADCEYLAEVEFVGVDAYDDYYVSVDIDSAFARTPWLGTPHDFPVYFEIDGNGVLTGWDYPIAMPATLDIPEGVTAIDDYVFEEAWRVSTVNLPSTLKSIGTGAFSSCESLTTVNGLTDSVEVAPFAFHMTPFDEARPFGLDVVDDRVMGFHGRPCPSALELPEGVTNVAGWAFSYWDYNRWEEVYDAVADEWYEYDYSALTNLQSVLIPASVDAIGEYAFEDCTNLVSVSIGNPEVKIDGSAFGGCKKLALNIEKEGYTLAGWDLWREKNPQRWAEQFDDDGNFIGYELEEFEPDFMPTGTVVRVADIAPLVYGMPTDQLRTNWVLNAGLEMEIESIVVITNTLEGIWATPVWEPNRYTVTFDANGGAGTMAAQEFVYDEEQLLSECAFVRPAYEFLGWSLAADSDDIAFFDGENVLNLTSLAGDNITFYAVWQRTSLWAPVVGNDPLGGELDGDETMTGDAAEVYDGFVQTPAGKVVGTITVKVAKAKPDKKTQKLSAKVTVTIQLLGEKKQTIKGTVDVGTGAFAGKDGQGRELSLLLGANSLSGTYGPYVIDGAQNKFKTKKAAAKALGDAALAQKKGTWSVAWKEAAGWNGMSLTVGAKGKVKIAGVLANGTKVSATSQLLVGEDSVCVIPVVITKKASLAFNVWLTADGVEVMGMEGDVVAGRVNALKSGAVFNLDAAAFAAYWQKEALPYLPDGVSVAQSGAKWTVASGAKGGKVVLKKGTTEVDEGKLGANPSGLKITYTAKTGTFKGSFKAYVLEGGKPKATTVNVTGVLVDGVGYGTVSIKKVAGGVPVTVE